MKMIKSRRNFGIYNLLQNKHYYFLQGQGSEDKIFLATAYYTAWKILTYESQRINFCDSMSDFAFAHAIGPEIVRWLNVPESTWKVELFQAYKKRGTFYQNKREDGRF